MESTILVQNQMISGAFIQLRKVLYSELQSQFVNPGLSFLKGAWMSKLTARWFPNQHKGTLVILQNQFSNLSTHLEAC